MHMYCVFLFDCFAFTLVFVVDKVKEKWKLVVQFFGNYEVVCFFLCVFICCRGLFLSFTTIIIEEVSGKVS